MYEQLYEGDRCWDLAPEARFAVFNGPYLNGACSKPIKTPVSVNAPRKL
jgi:hypothetical protein